MTKKRTTITLDPEVADALSIEPESASTIINRVLREYFRTHGWPTIKRTKDTTK